jgi:hypothetical protein
MATTTAAQQRALMALETFALMLDDLPQVASEWEHLSDGERTAWSIDWQNEVSGLARLARFVSAGLLTCGQYERYRELLARLVTEGPTLRALQLAEPAIPLAAIDD